MTTTTDIKIETDGRGRASLGSGRANQHYLMSEMQDGTLVLHPARLVTQAQAAYDNDPEFRAMVDAGVQGPVERHPRRTSKRTYQA